MHLKLRFLFQIVKNRIYLSFAHKGDFFKLRYKHILFKKLLTPTPKMCLFSEVFLFTQFFSSVMIFNLFFNLIDNLFCNKNNINETKQNKTKSQQKLTYSVPGSVSSALLLEQVY